VVKAPPPAPLEIVFKVHLGCDRGRSGKQKRCSRNARRRREGRAVQGQEEEEEEEEVQKPFETISRSAADSGQTVRAARSS